ncbi:MAG: AraC family transcriptional regulator [Flavobacteriaceae bacterium]|nr:AraC family transcriptional regulator [Flavobacteriaceae bacterium]
MKESRTKSDYVRRMDRVFHYIDENLSSPLSLDLVAAKGHFSPFHFHRVFKIITGETLNSYIIRRRLEKAAMLLLHNTELGIEAISSQVGFNSHASFTRAFKSNYGKSPSLFRKSHTGKIGKIRKVDSKIDQEFPKFEKYICSVMDLKNWIAMNASIEIKEVPVMKLAYVTSIGIQNLENSYVTLMKWGRPLGLMNDETKMITVYHDSFKVTSPHRVRMSACMLLDEEMETEGEIGFKELEVGKCIVARFEIGLDEFEKSWTGLFVWMNEQGYEKADRDPFGIYHNDFNKHPENMCIVDLCIPVL